MTRKSIYLASPLGFADSTRPYMELLVAMLAEHVDVLNPWDKHAFDDDFARLAGENDFASRHDQLFRINTEIGRLNVADIDRADGVFAILDGVDVDSGTASEIGYGFARGKFICGMRTDFRLSADNYGSTVNLQVEYFITASGGQIVRTAEEFANLAREFAQREPVDAS
jgi:nucleoside 2-deoxyribosyltransferase